MEYVSDCLGTNLRLRWQFFLLYSIKKQIFHSLRVPVQIHNIWINITVHRFGFGQLPFPQAVNPQPSLKDVNIYER